MSERGRVSREAAVEGGTIKKPVRVLWMSDSPLVATGFGRVTRELLARLAGLPTLEVACLGWGYDGWPYERERFPYVILPGVSAAQAGGALDRAVEYWKPDVLMTLGEIWMLDWLPEHPRRPKFRWIAYLPIDGGPFYPPWKAVLNDADMLVAMSEFGREVLAGGMPTRRIECIRHGVDLDRFRPLAQRNELRRHPRLGDKFVVACVARNQPRKNLPTLVKAFALLVRKGLPVHLLLHTNPCDVGFDLVTLLQRYGLEGNADVSSPTFAVESPWEDATLNRVYNLADVIVLPSVGEGFGLPLLEAMAAGVPVIAGDHSACRELIQGRGELSRVLTTVTTGANLIEYPVLDVEDLAARIEKLYRNSGLRQTYGDAGREFAKGLSWDSLIPQWLRLIRTTTGVEFTS